MPPVLLQNWKRNIEKFPGTDVLMVYAGTPAQRKKLTFDKQFILVGLQMFKRDIKRFEAELGNCRLFVVVDEAQVLKNPALGQLQTGSGLLTTERPVLADGDAPLSA
jgi:SNF2 family DNA or RNA helicase